MVRLVLLVHLEILDLLDQLVQLALLVLLEMKDIGVHSGAQWIKVQQQSTQRRLPPSTAMTLTAMALA